jgi:hypothetical protein
MIPQHIKDKPRMTKEFRESLKHNHAEAFCHMLYISHGGRPAISVISIERIKRNARTRARGDARRADVLRRSFD